MMMFIGVIGVSDDVPVLGAYPIFWNERRVYSSLSPSDAPFQKLPSLLLKKHSFCRYSILKFTVVDVLFWEEDKVIIHV